MTPSSFDVPYYRNRAAPFMRQHRLGQASHKWCVGDNGSGLTRPQHEIVESRGAGAVTREEKGDHAVDVGVRGQVGRGIVIRRVDAAHSGPILTQKGTMLRLLLLMPRRPATDTMSGGEEQRLPTSLAAPCEQVIEGRLRRRGPDGHRGGIPDSSRDTWLIFTWVALKQGRNQSLGADSGRWVVGMLGRKESRRALAGRCLTIFEADHTLPVAVVVGRGIEVDPPHGIFDVEQILELVRNLGWAAYHQQVIGDLGRIDVPRPGAVAPQPIGPRLGSSVIEHLDRIVAELCDPMIDQGLDRGSNLSRLIRAEDHAPTRLRWVGWIDVVGQSQMGTPELLQAGLETPGDLGIPPLAPDQHGKFCRLHRMKQILACLPVDTVGEHGLVGHSPSSRGHDRPGAVRIVSGQSQEKMAKIPMRDVVVMLPGIIGSVLQKNGKDVWAVSGGAGLKALLSLGGSIKDLRLGDDPQDVDDLGDGVTAPRILPDLSLIPGFWKIDRYGRVTKTIKGSFDVTPGLNYFEFPYDWRRDNRVAARKLADSTHTWLSAWREHSGNDDAKLILIAHSMGGLISRYFLEVLEGWKDTRLLLTFGTPYRGSLNAMSFLAKGMRKKLGPITLIDLSDLLGSFTSVYQLLPIYPCVDTGAAELGRVSEVSNIPGIDQQRASAALGFHRSISEAVEHHLEDAAYVERGYKIQPLAGIFQPTLQSARLRQGEVSFLRSYQGDDHGGDGTVPRVSATPLEFSNQDREIYIKERHSSLQNTAHALAQLTGVLSSQVIDQSIFFAPTTGLSLEIDDAYLEGEHLPVRALPEVEWAELTVSIEDTDTGASVARADLQAQQDGWHEAVLDPVAAGTYRLTVTGNGDIQPVTDLIAVFSSGAV